MTTRPLKPGFCIICGETHFLCDRCDPIAAAAVEARRQTAFAEILDDIKSRPRRHRIFPPRSDEQVDHELARQEGWEFTREGWR